MSDEAFIEKWAGILAEVDIDGVNDWRGHSKSEREHWSKHVRDIIADLRATPPPAAPLVLAPEEREALEHAFLCVLNRADGPLTPTARAKYERTIATFGQMIGGRGPNNDCAIFPYSSRACERGTRSCITRHDAASPSQPVAPATDSPARGGEVSPPVAATTPITTSTSGPFFPSATESRRERERLSRGPIDLDDYPDVAPATPPAGEPVTKLTVLHECRLCSRTGWSVSGYLPPDWGRLVNVDGPYGVCEPCCKEPTALDSIVNDYPSVRLRWPCNEERP